MTFHSLDPNWTIKAVHHLRSSVGMVPVSTILCRFPSICPSASRLDRLLRQARHSIRPRSPLLFDTMKMNRCIERQVVVNSKLYTISQLSSPAQYFRIGNLTSTSSPWSSLSSGPGNWLFMKTISRTFPSGAPFCQVRSKSKWTSLAQARGVIPELAKASKVFKGAMLDSPLKVKEIWGWTITLRWWSNWRDLLYINDCESAIHKIPSLGQHVDLMVSPVPYCPIAYQWTLVRPWRFGQFSLSQVCIFDKTPRAL